MKDGNVQLFFESRFDLEATRRGDVFEVDPAKGNGDCFDGAHDLVRVFRVEAYRKSIDAGELLEEHRLSFHYRHRRRRPNIAKAEHGRAVGDYGNGVLLDSKGKSLFRVVTNGFTDARDSGRVGH